MEENTNYTFKGVTGNFQSKCDGKLWYFEDQDANFSAIIPIKSISSVSMLRERSWGWLIALVAAIAALIIGHFYGQSEILYYAAILLFVVAVILYIFSFQYTVRIIPHSGIEQKIVARKKGALDKFYEALEDSLRANF